MSHRDDLALAEYLGHIRQAIGRIHRYVGGLDYATFLENEEKQDAVIRNLEVIGEAAGNVLRHFPEFCAQHPSLPLTAAYQTRNALSHGYFKVDLAIVWRTIERDLPSLDEQIAASVQARLLE